MTIPEFIRTHGIAFARRRVAANPHLAHLGFNVRYHFRVAIRCDRRRLAFFLSSRSEAPSDEDFLRGLAIEAREARIPDGEFSYATSRLDHKPDRLLRRAAGLQTLLGEERFLALTTTVLL